MPSPRLARAARRTTAHVAQSVEHLHGKQKVSGSIPLVGSINSNGAPTAALIVAVSISVP